MNSEPGELIVVELYCKNISPSFHYNNLLNSSSIFRDITFLLLLTSEKKFLKESYKKLSIVIELSFEILIKRSKKFEF